MNELPPDNDRQPPVRLPRERLVLPGPRALWWLVAALAIALPLSAHIAGELGEKSAPADAMTAELRGRTFMWRLLTNTQPQRQKTPGEKPPADAAAKEIQKAEDDDWRELVAHAREVDAAHAEARAREQVIVHALAVERPDRAVALAREVTVLSQDVRAVLAGLPDAPTASILDPKTALGLLHTRGFGHGWSAYQRDQARRLAYERLDDLESARALNASLRQRDNRLVPAWSTAALLFLAALIFGAVFWIRALGPAEFLLLGSLLLVGAFAPGPAGLLLLLALLAGTTLRRNTPRRLPVVLATLRASYPGLPRDLPYLTDPLVPWLGLGGWLTGYLLASVLLAVLAGQRSMSGLGVLFQSGVGALTAIAVVQNFARHPPGLPHAARLSITADLPHEAPQLTLTQAFLASLRVLSPLIPAMVVVVLLLTRLGITNGEHPVAGMVFTDTDPLQLSAIGISVALFAPLGEELIFRGFLYRALRMRFGVWPALAMTSLVFSALHPSLGPYFVLSAAFCLAYEWTGSLWTSVLLHGLWNALSFAALVGVAIS